MIKSMTGFARSEISSQHGIFTAELKTLNHKFLELTFKLPNSLAIFDDRVKELLKSRIKRGKVYLNFTHESGEESGGNITIDEKLAKNYCARLKKMRDRLNIEDTIKISDIISFPGVVNYKLTGRNISRMWPSVKEVITRALDRLVKDREREGSFLERDLMRRIKRIKSIVIGINKKSSANVRSYKNKLSSKIKELSGGYPMERGRLEMEVALFAKNSDISEELTRLKNHIQNFTRTIKKKGESGKKMDFIAQELHREVNTIGSKSSGFNISKGVIEIKTEIEKIREQLKNIE